MTVRRFAKAALRRGVLVGAVAGSLAFLIIFLAGCGRSTDECAGCETRITKLEAQVADLEKRLAEQNPAAKPTPETAGTSLPEALRREQDKTKTMVSLGAFNVSLNDSAGQSHFLQVEITLEAWDAEQAVLLESQRDRLRDMINLVLGARPYERLRSLSQRLELKEEIKINVDRTVGAHAVRDVLFGAYFLN